jgi:hypothetical protein
MDWLVPTDTLGEHALVALVALGVTALSVFVHYEGVHWLARRYSRRALSRAGDRRAIFKIVLALLGLHVAEIWCFGLAYWGLIHVPGAGGVHGASAPVTLFDAIYLSATTYSTLGIGDLAPVGAIRLLSGMEALTGLLLITWSASFTYLEMSRLWGDGTRAE